MREVFYPEPQADIDAIYRMDSPFPVAIVATWYEERPDGVRRVKEQKNYHLVESETR